VIVAAPESRGFLQLRRAPGRDHFLFALAASAARELALGNGLPSREFFVCQAE